MKMIRPQLARLIDGKRSWPPYALSQLHLKISTTRSPGNFQMLLARNSQMLTRICNAGYCGTSVRRRCVMLRSPARNPGRIPTSYRNLRETRPHKPIALDRPVDHQPRGSLRASVVAIARPIPAVLPRTVSRLVLKFQIILVARADPAVLSCSVRPSPQGSTRPVITRRNAPLAATPSVER